MPLIVFRPREIAYSLQLPLVSKTIIVANGCFDVACQFDFLLFQTIFPAIARHRRLAKTMDNVIVFHPISANCQQINCLKLTCCRSGVTPKSFRSSRELHSIKINYSILSSHIIVKKEKPNNMLILRSDVVVVADVDFQVSPASFTRRNGLNHGEILTNFIVMSSRIKNSLPFASLPAKNGGGGPASYQ